MSQAQQQIESLFDKQRKEASESADEAKRVRIIDEEERPLHIRSQGFAEEQRRAVIEEENNAMQQFLDFLETLSPEVTEIVLREPLSGDIDLSILKECNFHMIDRIAFVPGKITSIRNIPLGIKRFECPENLLVELPDCPETIVDLILHHNYLKHIDLSPLKNLKEINVNNNQLTHLVDFPESIESIYCDHNFLTTIDLKGIKNLKVLHCSSNRMVRIENFPEDTIQDFKMENNLMITIHNATSNDEEGEGVPVDFPESLDTYFELKKMYERTAYKIKKETFDRAPSKKAARELLKQVKPKCVNCKRPVGSIFMTDKRTYIAKCGDTKSPCNFNIKLYAGSYGSLVYLLEAFHTYTEDGKDTIMKQKLDTLFNYVSESRSIQLFKKHYEEYTETATFLKQLTDEYNDLYHNEERALKIEKKMGDIFKVQERVNELFNKYKENENPQILQDAMTIYKDELRPEIANLRLLQYSLCEMIDEYSDKKLIQHTIPIEKRDFTFGSFPKVIHFSKN
jgi:hypothetical protein